MGGGGGLREVTEGGPELMNLRRAYEIFPKDPSKTMEAWIICRGKRNVMGSCRGIKVWMMGGPG